MATPKSPTGKSGDWRADYTIIGVTPQAFIGTELVYTPEIFVPMAMGEQIEQSQWLGQPGRPRMVWRSAGSNQAFPRRVEAGPSITIATELGRQYPKNDGGVSIVLSPPGMAGNFLRGAITGFSAVLMVVAGLVLLIACVNLASLLLARASDRRKGNRDSSCPGSQPRPTSAAASHREPDAIDCGRRGGNPASPVAQQPGERLASSS